MFIVLAFSYLARTCTHDSLSKDASQHVSIFTYEFNHRMYVIGSLMRQEVRLRQVGCLLFQLFHICHVLVHMVAYRKIFTYEFNHRMYVIGSLMRQEVRLRQVGCLLFSLFHIWHVLVHMIAYRKTRASTCRYLPTNLTIACML